jgi:membrane-bound metal-dependent hydrolase YbcI (DUF457 family)
MLGKHHLSISILTILPFLIPLLFLGNQNYVSYFIAVLFSVAVGSLMPDADCGGKSKLYYDFKFVYYLMLPIQKFTLWIFNHSKIKTKLKLKYEVDNEHRGIMHSPIGVFISSTIITLVFLIVLLIIGQFNLILVFLVLFGLIIGQLLHLLEDSCTVSGINWKFPFGEKILKGGIYTFEKVEGKVDVRPFWYQNILIGITVLLILGYAFGLIEINIFLIYLITLTLIVLSWIVFILLSKQSAEKWNRDKKELAERRKRANQGLKDLDKMFG